MSLTVTFSSVQCDYGRIHRAVTPAPLVVYLFATRSPLPRFGSFWLEVKALRLLLFFEDRIQDSLSFLITSRLLSVYQGYLTQAPWLFSRKRLDDLTVMMIYTLLIYWEDSKTMPQVTKLLASGAAGLSCFSHLVTSLYDRYLQALLLFFITLILLQITRTRNGIPDIIPWTGVHRRTFFPRTRATLGSVPQNKEYLEEGFRKEAGLYCVEIILAGPHNPQFSRQGVPFVLSNLLTGPDVILPWSHIQWLLDETSSILSQAGVNRYSLETGYTMLHPNIVRDTVHERDIRAHLQKQLEYLTNDVTKELTLRLDMSWRSEIVKWKTFPAFNSMTDVFIAQSIKCWLDYRRVSHYKITVV